MSGLNGHRRDTKWFRQRCAWVLLMCWAAVSGSRAWGIPKESAEPPQTPALMATEPPEVLRPAAEPEDGAVM